MRRIERVLLCIAITLAGAALLRAELEAGRALGADGDGAGHPIATVAISDVVDELMAGDRFEPERVEFEAETREELMGDMVERLREMEQRAESMDPGDEGFEQAREEYFRLQGRAQRANQEVLRRVEAFVAKQIVECYKLVVSSAQAIAGDLGYDYVIASNGQERPLEEESVRDLVIDILGRPMLVSPESADITPDVRDDLKL